MIRIENVTKRFGRATVVDGASLHIEAGDAAALWGPNGAGKSTLIRCVLGLLEYSGTISVGGIDVASDGKAARALIGYVPQELGFYDDMRVGEAVRFFARLRGMRVASVDDALEGVGLFGHACKRIRELSGGMKQRLALGIALQGDPPVLVLDEVTASLDACGRGEFVDLLRAKAGADGRKTILFASHRIEEIEAMARRVAMMKAGKLISVKPAAEFVDELGGAAGGGDVLRLRIEPALRVEAAAALRARGFEPTLNGVGVLVPVTLAGKIAPLSLLAEARIPVRDFDLVRAATLNGHRGEKS